MQSVGYNDSRGVYNFCSAAKDPIVTAKLSDNDLYVIGSLMVSPKYLN